MASDTKWTTSADTAAWRGVTWRDPAERTGAPPRSDPCCEPCPDCGGLECLCRPRFFAGQLLTERELNGLQDYVIAKNKLHNRYLVGRGIVCGLEAQCDPCGDMVRVTPGYAISPCGEDIVVCKPDAVDICALIARCRETDEPDCRPYAPGKDGCADIVEEWVLAIRYAEAPSRTEAVKTAKTDCGCGCGGKGPKKTCGCGGTGGCGCSSQPAMAATSAARSAEPVLRRGAPPACVPQQTCESYRYDVFRAPEQKQPDLRRDPEHPVSGLLGALQGPLVERLRCCLREIEDAVPPGVAGSSEDAAFRQAAVRWFCDVRNNLKRVLLRRSGHDCALIERLMTLPIPPTDNQQVFDQVSETAATELLAIAFEMMLECVCSALLPACPEAEDPRLPIAVVKIRRGSCDILSVCNWTPLRRQLVTWPAMGYWLGWAPQIATLREYLHLMCCEGFGLFDNLPGRTAGKKAYAPGAAPQAETAAPADVAEAAPAAMQPKTMLMAQTLQSVLAQRAAGLPTYDAGPGGFDAGDLMTSLAGPRDADGLRLAAAERIQAELLHPLREALPLEAMTAPLDWLLPGARALQKGDLGTELAALRQTIAEQNGRIAVLEKAMSDANGPNELRQDAKPTGPRQRK